MPFRIIRDDITKVKADVIVNTANPKVTNGKVRIMPAFFLEAKYVIHLSAPY